MLVPGLSILAAQDGGGAHSFAALLTALAAILIATRLVGDLAQRFGQPAVLGELVAGVLLGPSLLSLVDPTDPVIHSLAELGVLILLFQIGLHTDLKSILRVGAAAALVGLVGVALPFLLGLGVLQALGVTGVTAIVCAAALTATSIGISARVLSELGQLESPEGRIVLGAAVLDDVVGLIILSVVSGLARGAALSLGTVSRVTVVALGFILLAILVGGRIALPAMRLARRIRVSGALGTLALAFALAFGAAASAAGSAVIIGAFAAGLVLYRTPERAEIEKAVTGLGHFFVPVFFAAVGAAVDLRSLAEPRVLAIGGALVGVGVAGKFLAGFAPWWFQGDRTLIGVAMIPRGEVGLIFAQMGLTAGVLDRGLFSAVLLMVMATTFVAPPWLAALARRRRATGPKGGPEGPGLDDLVAGSRG